MNIGAFSLVVAISILAGCASVTAVCGGSKVIHNAICTLENDKGRWFVTSPGSTMIQKSFGDLTVTCKKQSVTDAVIVKSMDNTNVWGNLLAGGLIGYAVNTTSGAGFNYPTMISVSINSNCS